MPSYWTPKEERQYRHIKTSCLQRRCRRKTKSCIRTCTRIAAATTNKFRSKGLGRVRGKCCVVRGRKRIACFYNREDAVVLARELRRRKGVKVYCV